MSEVTTEHIGFIEKLFTPLVSDVMDRMGIHSHVLGRDIQSIPFDPKLKVAGVAFPCRVVPTSEYVEIDTLLGMVDSIPANAFVAVAADADIDAALWGGLMSTRAKMRGARAAVVNGGVRDFEQIDNLHFPVFGTYRCVKDIRRRGYMHSFGVEVTMDGVRIRPGDIIFGDANGVVVIPHESLADILIELETSLTGEKRTALGLQSGVSARELFQDFKTF
jgi:regulator of RNase E activity RraA